MAIPFLKGIDVSGTVDLSNLTIDSAQGTDGQVLTSTGSGIAWENASGGASLSGGEASKVAVWSATDTLTHHDNFHFDTTNVRLGIGTPSPSSMLHLKSTGDVKLILEADSDNSGENDNPLIELKQDNSGIIGRLGMVGDAGQLFTNSRTNSTGLGTVYQQDLIFFTENSARVYIKGESGYQGRVGIGTATPSHELHITGTGLASSSFRAPIFYDSDNTDYYVNPSASGVSLHINGIIDQDFQVTDLNSAWTAPGTSRDQGFIVGRYQGNASNRPHHNDNANWFANIYSHASGGTASYGIQLAGSNAASGENSLSLRTVSNGSFSSWRKVFHEGHTPTAAEVGAAASSHNHAASDITSGTFATARIPSLDASKITSGTFSDLFANSTRYNFGLIDGNSSQTRDKLRVWNSSSYTIGMKSGFTFGHLNDYAMSFQMNNDNDRGWWWGDDAHTDAQGAMSLTTNGKLTVATSLSIGQGESITSASTVPLFVDGTAVFDTTSNTEPVCISRSGSTSTEVLKIGVTDTIATFNYIEDTSSEGTGNFGRYDFILGGNSSETSVTPLILEKTKTTSNAGAFTFGTPGNGSNTLGRWLSFEGNADSSGEGSGRLFFSEHNSSTTDMDDYGMSIGYRGGSASVTTAGGNSWTGLSQISNGQWGMWGHDNSLAGSLIMSGDRNATYVDFNGNNITNAGDLTATGLFIGGTGSANKLDDYEEGDANLTFGIAYYYPGSTISFYSGTTSFGSWSDNSKYVKVGSSVTVYIDITFSNSSQPSGWLSSSHATFLGGLPFSVAGSYTSDYNKTSPLHGDYGFGQNLSGHTSDVGFQIRPYKWGTYGMYFGFSSNSSQSRTSPLRNDDFNYTIGYSSYGVRQITGVIHYRTTQ